MNRVLRLRCCLLVTIACLGGAACQLRRPSTLPIRMIEPQLLEPQVGESLDTQARGHIGRRVLHEEPDGELTEDHVWLWSSAPDRYLDTALRLQVESSPICASSIPAAFQHSPRHSSYGI